MKRQKLSITFSYLFLAVSGLAIPLVHHRLNDQIIEASPIAGGAFRDIGFLAWLLPVPAFVAGILSLCFDYFRSFEGVCFIAMAMFICASLDAIYCMVLLSAAV